MRADQSSLFRIMGILLLTLREDPAIDLNVAVTGTHLSKVFGMTVEEIESDGFPIGVRIPILKDVHDTSESISQIMARAMDGFGTYFQDYHPELLIVLGDRYVLRRSAPVFPLRICMVEKQRKD